MNKRTTKQIAEMRDKLCDTISELEAVCENAKLTDDELSHLEDALSRLNEAHGSLGEVVPLPALD